MQHTLRYPGFWLAVGLVAIGMVCQAFLALPLELLDTALREGKSKPLHLVRVPWVLGVINILAISAAIGVGLLVNRLSPRRAFPFGRLHRLAWVAVPVLIFGAGIVLSEADNLLRWFLPPPKFLAEIMAQLFFPAEQLLGQTFLLVLVAPVTEELLFRGIILRGLLSRYRPWVAVGLSALLFSAMHLNPWQAVSAFVLGLILGWFYLRTGSLWPCLFGHACLNSLVVLASAAPFGWWEAPTTADLLRVEFQPWWLDAIGAVLMVAGFCLFRKGSPEGPRDLTAPKPPMLSNKDVPPRLPVQ